MGDKHTLKVGFSGSLEDKRVEVPAGEAPPWDADTRTKYVGARVPRIDGPMKVSGRAKYTFDVNLPGLLHAAVLRSPLPSATVESIDTSAAEQQPGVKAVVAVAKPGERMLFAGQDVAAVAATTMDQARDALRHIKVAYKSTPHVVETTDAMRDGAPTVHKGKVEERRTEGDEPGGGGASKTSGNVRPGRPMKSGNVARGLRGAKYSHEATYTTPVQTHSSLETHGIAVRWDSKKSMTVWSSTQGIFGVRDDMAELFGLKQSDVHVITEFLGGGFGSKFGAAASGTRLGFMCGELARQAGKPVKLMCTRHEEHTCTGNRPSSRQVVKVAANGAKKLTAIHVVSHGTAGIGTGAGVGRNAFHIYTRCKNILVEPTDVFVNAGPATAMRAPGHPQGAFALELALDELAVKMDVDPVDLRLKHDEHPLRLHQLKLGRERFGWDQKRKQSKALRDKGTRIRRGFGVAASVWGDFGRPKAAVATVSVGRDGVIEVRNGVQDIGTGISTVLAQVAAEVFRRPIETIKVRYGDSEFGSSVGSGGSQTTSSVTPAVRNASEQVKTELTQLAAKLLKAESGARVQWDQNGSARVGNETMTFDQICRRIDGESITATATRPATYGSHPMKFMDSDRYQIGGIQFAEVEVDTWTGVVRCPHVLAIHDCGRVMNELTLTSQVNGGVLMGLSYALMEQRVMDRESGLMLNPNLDQYKIAGVRDTPRIEVVLTEVFAGNNNTGAIGIGEPATIPTAAAIANGVFDAIGAPVRSLPLTPDVVLAALGAVPGVGGGATG